MGFLSENTKAEKLIILQSLLILFPYYIAITALVAISIYVLITEGRSLFKSDYKDIKWIVAFLIYSMVVSLIFNNSLGFFASVALAFLMVFFVYFKKYYRPELKEKLLKSFIYVSGGIFLLSIVFHIVKLAFYVDGSWAEKITANRASSFYFNPNYFSTLAAYCFLIGLYRFNSVKTNRARLKMAAYLLICAVSVFIANSRTAQIALIISSLYMAFRLGNKKTLLLLTVGIILSVAIVLGADFLETTRIQNEARDVNMRMLIWQRAADFIKKNYLIGVGPFGMNVIYKTFFPHFVIHAHNIFLDFFVNFGIIGLALIYNFLYDASSAIFSMKKTNIRHLATAFIVYTVIHGLLDVTIFWHQTAYVFLMVVMMALAENIRTGEEK